VRIFSVLVLALMVSIPTVGDVQSQSANPEPATSQATHRPLTPKCKITDAKDCQLSKKNHEYIEWRAPRNEDRYFCFPSNAPFGQPIFHLSPGQHQPTPDLVGDPAVGTKFTYTTGSDPCPGSQNRTNTAKVIIGE
jgi:hypothetical protein